MFKKATKKHCKMRVLLEGASGSGKTWSALLLAEFIAKQEGTRIAFIDTEDRSGSLYSDRFDFDTCGIEAPFTPEKYIAAIKYAEDNGYGVIVVDSISHEWIGTGGCLDIHGKMTGNSYTNWNTVTPRHDKFIDALTRSKVHLIGTCRSATEYLLVENNKRKMVPTKQGTKPKQRDGLDYEMTIVFTLNENHMAIATKDRTGIFSGKDHIIDEDTASRLWDWLLDGENIEKAINACTTRDELVTIFSSLSGGSKAQHEETFMNKSAEIKAKVQAELAEQEAIEATLVPEPEPEEWEDPDGGLCMNKGCTSEATQDGNFCYVCNTSSPEELLAQDKAQVEPTEEEVIHMDDPLNG